MKTALRWFRHLLFVEAILVVVALVGLNVLAWRGDLVHDASAGALRLPPTVQTTPAQTVVAAAPVVNTATPVQAPTPERTLDEGPAGGSTAATTFVALSAGRGDSYLEIRAGSASGPVRWSGILRQGETARVAGKRLWIRLGAAQNLDVTLDGQPVTSLPSSTGDLIATASGVRVIAIG